MKNLFPLVLVACCSVACVVSSPDDKPSQAGVQKGANDPQPTPPPSPNDPPNPQDDPSDQEGASCDDPAPVTPQGWEMQDLGDYDVAIPPGVVKKSLPPGDDHIWLVVDHTIGKQVGFFQVAGLSWATSLDEVEAREKTDFTLMPDGTTLPSPLTFTRGTHECLEELIAKGTPSRTPDGNVIEWHHVMVGGVPVLFGCDLPPSMASMCADFAGSFHVE